MTITHTPLTLFGLSLLEGQDINVGPYAWKTEVDLSVLCVPYELKGRTFEEIRSSFEQETGNPKVSVPTIKVDDEFVTESWVIAQWLDEKYGTPERSLFGGSEAGYAIARFINVWADKDLGNEIVPLFAPWLYQAQNTESSKWFVKQKLGGDTAKIEGLVQLSKDDTFVETHAAAVREKLQTLERHLAQLKEDGKGPFIAGTDYPTHADSTVFGWYGASAAVRPYDLVTRIWKHESLPLVSAWVDAVIEVSGVRAPAYDY